MKIARHVRKLEAYTPGEQPKSKHVVKLNTNENPYPPSPKCKAVLECFDLDFLRRYPDPEFTALREAIAKLNHTSPSRVFVGNGSDEILSLAARTFVENDEAIGSLDPSYSLYKTLAAIRDVKWIGISGVPRTSPPADIRNESMVGADVPAARCSLFLLTNPNAPTGEWKEPKIIADFARRFKGVVIVDEAYADFAKGNCMKLATAMKNKNIIVMRTFSKSYSLAGLRVGYCVGPEDLIAALYKMKDSYNVDAIAQAIALAAIKDQAWMKANTKKVIAERKRLTRELEKRGWNVTPSESNFIFAKPAKIRAEKLFQTLKARNIFVRYFKGPKTGDRLRITIGTPEQNNTLLKAIDEL